MDDKLVKKKKTPEEREFEKLVKLFTSSIFDMKHGYIYLDTEHPTTMICATYSPDELYGRSRVLMDTVRLVETEINLIELWGTKLPIEGFTRFCISYSGIRSMKSKFDGDFKAMLDAWIVHPINGMRYVEKISKQGKREKIEIRPIIWPLSEIYFRDLKAHLTEACEWVENCPVVATYDVTKAELDRSLVSTLNHGKTNIAVGIKIPYANGFNCTSLFGYSNVTKLDKVTLHLGQDGHIVRFYCTSKDDYATVTSALPVGYYYGKLSIEDKQGELNNGNT